MDPTTFINEKKCIFSKCEEKPLSDKVVIAIDKTSESGKTVITEEKNNSSCNLKTFSFSKRPKISEADMLEKESILEEGKGVIKEEEGIVKEEEGIVKEEEGVIKEEEGVIEKEEGVIKEEEGTIKEDEGVIDKEEGIVNEEEGVSDQVQGSMFKLKEEKETFIVRQEMHTAKTVSIEKEVTISEKDKCENKLKNTFILNGDFASGTFTLIVTEHKNGANPNLSKAIILGEKEDASGRYKATIFKNSGYKAGVEFKREGKTYVTEFATKEEEKEFLGIWNNYLTVMKNSSKEDKEEEKSQTGKSNAKETTFESEPLQFPKKDSLDVVKEAQRKESFSISNDATLKNSRKRNAKIEKENLEKEVKSEFINNKGIKYNREKSDIQVYEIFGKKIQELNLELNNSNIELNGHHEILVYHQPKKRRVA